MKSKNLKLNFFAEYFFTSRLFLALILLFTVVKSGFTQPGDWNPWNTKVIPVYVYDYEGHTEYTDEAIATIICQLNNNFKESNYCVSSGSKVAGFRFALQTIKRRIGVISSGSTPSTFMNTVSSSEVKPLYGLHIYLYDFRGSTDPRGAYIGVSESKYKNCILITKLGFNDKTVTHETGHFLGLDHVGSGWGTLEHAGSTCSFADDVGTGATSKGNFMISPTTPAVCYFSANQIETMHCYWWNHLNPSPAITSDWRDRYPALVSSTYMMPATLVQLGYQGNALQVKVVNPSCPNYAYGYMTYTIDYCGDGPGGSSSPDDVWDEPMDPSTIISLYRCTGGTVTIKKFWGSAVNQTSYKFDPDPSCTGTEPGPHCEVTLPGEYYGATPLLTIPGTEEYTEEYNSGMTAKGNMNIKIYPTLASNNLNIIGTNDRCQYAISDMSGNILKTGKVSTVIDISTLSSGTYIIRFTDQKNVTVKRFSKVN